MLPRAHHRPDDAFAEAMDKIEQAVHTARAVPQAA
jgi:hypothetical protein